MGQSWRLSRGSYELQMRLSLRPGDKDNHGGIDVMALTNFPWAPTGVIPPDTTTREPQPR